MSDANQIVDSLLEDYFGDLHKAIQKHVASVSQDFITRKLYSTTVCTNRLLAVYYSEFEKRLTNLLSFIDERALLLDWEYLKTRLHELAEQVCVKAKGRASQHLVNATLVSLIPSFHSSAEKWKAEICGTIDNKILRVSMLQQQVSKRDRSEGAATTGEYDVFISHATEDKEEVVRPLVNALLAEGLRVWYDEFELRIGDSLRRSIDAGLRRSTFGVVVFSHSFFAKNWPQYELDGLVAREMTGHQVILPLWHCITKSEVSNYSLSLADKVARSTADFTIEELAHEIADVIKHPRRSSLQTDERT